MTVLTRSEKMHPLLSYIRVLFIVFLGSSLAWADGVSSKLSSLEITNLQHPLENIYASGQPAEESFSALAQAGIQVIVNLRPQVEQDWNEQAVVESLGMRYINLPIAGSGGVTHDNAKKLAVILAELEGKQVLVHCSSGNRVGALTALNSFEKNDGDLNAAIDEGKKWGLTALEPFVREKLSK